MDDPKATKANRNKRVMFLPLSSLCHSGENGEAREARRAERVGCIHHYRRVQSPLSSSGEQLQTFKGGQSRSDMLASPGINLCRAVYSAPLFVCAGRRRRRDEPRSRRSTCLSASRWRRNQCRRSAIRSILIGC